MKRRKRDPLGENHRDKINKKYIIETSKLLSNRAITKLTPESARTKINIPNANRIIFPRKAIKMDTPPKLSQNQS